MTDEQANERKRLDSGSIWLPCTIGDVDFDVEAFEAFALLGPVDRAHKNDPDECLACGERFVTPDDQIELPAKQRTCPKCGAAYDKIAFAGEFLDDVAALLRKRWGVKRCSRTEAGAFYSLVVDTVKEAKKNILPPQESATGSASTRRRGAKVKKPRG